MNTKANQQKNASPLTWMRKVSGGLKWAVLLLLLVQVALAAFAVWQAWILRDLVDRAAAVDLPGFRRVTLLLAGIILSQLAMRAALRFLKEFTSSGMENRCKERLFRALLKNDYAQVTAVHSEEWMNRITADTTVVADGYAEILPTVTGLIVRLTASLWSVLYLAKAFSWLLFPLGLLVAAFTFAARRRLKKMHKDIRETDGRLRVFMAERLSSLLIVRSFAREEASADGAEELMDDHRRMRMRRNHFANLCNVLLGAMIQGAVFLAVFWCARGILRGVMSYGTFTAVLELTRQIQSPFANLSGYIPRYFAMTASAERLMEAEAYEPDCPQPQKEPEEVRRFYREEFSAFVLRDAGFTYRPPAEESAAAPRSVVLSHVNAEIRKGDAVAVTGPSGCGKSTLLKLLMCLYPLDSGERCLRTAGGEVPLTAVWRRLFAYVPQGNQLMSGTIRQVVSFGDDSVPEERIWAALRISCARDFVSELPRGLDTVLGERGAGLSEGQMQRLAVARAILSGHPVLLLDEATSSLDEATEREMLDNIRSMTDATVIIVTHRPQALAVCDREIRMGEDGLEIRDLK